MIKENLKTVQEHIKESIAKDIMLLVKMFY